jgi:hypothetical protein
VVELVVVQTAPVVALMDPINEIVPDDFHISQQVPGYPRWYQIHPVLSSTFVMIASLLLLWCQEASSDEGDTPRRHQLVEEW